MIESSVGAGSVYLRYLLFFYYTLVFTSLKKRLMKVGQSHRRKRNRIISLGFTRKVSSKHR